MDMNICSCQFWNYFYFLRWWCWSRMELLSSPLKCHPGRVCAMAAGTALLVSITLLCKGEKGFPLTWVEVLRRLGFKKALNAGPLLLCLSHS